MIQLMLIADVCRLTCSNLSWARSVGIATGYELNGPEGWSSSPGRGKIFLLSTPSGPVLEPTQPPVQWVLGASFPVGKAARA
jgi:hypothetical protein